ncbi:MAG: radical SAM protein, partial [Candidatus Izemoplasmatales bacterium]|nr:radical SAM protein [Candidatus Izemoplasmatales bacterium]
MEEKTLNLHITDRCNFHCKHCFVNMQGKELTLDDCKRIIDVIYEMNEFTRINLAGGEPMMALHLQDVIDYVISKGFKCSLITNGSYLTSEFINSNKNKLCMIGISVDSMDDVINKLIGRKTIKNIVEICEDIKKANIKLKLNLCISKHNVGYDFKPIIERTKPDRLKVLQVLPTRYTKNVDSLIITKEEFHE